MTVSNLILSMGHSPDDFGDLDMTSTVITMLISQMGLGWRSLPERWEGAFVEISTLMLVTKVIKKVANTSISVADIVTRERAQILSPARIRLFTVTL